MPDQKTMQTRCLGGFSVMWVTKLLISPVRIRVFLPKNDQIWSKICIFGHLEPGPAGSFGAPLVGWLVVVARGLYLARHLFALSKFSSRNKNTSNILSAPNTGPLV